VVWLIGRAQSKKEPQYAKKNALRLAVGTGFANCFAKAAVVKACAGPNKLAKHGYLP
jgi:hypothetical protein